jgi:hypothetical protein
MTSPPQDEQAFGVYWPALVSAAKVQERVVLDDATSIAIERAARSAEGVPAIAQPPKLAAARALSSTDTLLRPLGLLCGARSGDKGGNANIGVWTEDDDAYAWLETFLSVEKLKSLLPEAQALRVDRFELPRLRALNFVVHGLLGDGVAASLRADPQAKTLGEYLRAKVVPLPTVLIARARHR